jgi:hypothetical protein
MSIFFEGPNSGERQTDRRTLTYADFNPRVIADKYKHINYIKMI